MRPPIKSPIVAYLQALHARLAATDDGEVASYIPELAKADPAWFGIAIATLDGAVYEVGHARQPFTIQSMSKPLVYGLALTDLGEQAVTAKVGVEPTGDAFNSISLEAGSGRPFNPMINAGAIAVSSLVTGATPEDRNQRILDTLSRYAGRALSVNQTVYESERDTGHRNRAIGHMLRNYGIIDADPDPALDLYFRQCSVEVDCRDLALMAATLANGGIHPVTGEEAIPSGCVASVLSIMTTCGMYDFAGEWVYRVGMPAKSGVAGGIFAVLPGQLGIGVFSPRLDPRGNSARGVAVCRALSEDLGLHVLLPPRTAAATMRARHTLAERRSRRRRNAAETAFLDAHGHTVHLLELQGDLRFSTLESVVRAIVQDSAGLAQVILDLSRVRSVDAPAMAILARLAETLAGAGIGLSLCGGKAHALIAHIHQQGVTGPSAHPDADAALEAGENALLARAALEPETRDCALPLASHGLCAGLTAEQLEILSAHLVHTRTPAGELLVRRGDTADALFLLMRGEASVLVSQEDGARRRLATLEAGMAFGESALLHGGHRSADIRADTAVECLILRDTAFATIQQSTPQLAIALLGNLLASSHEITARLTREIAAHAA